MSKTATEWRAGKSMLSKEQFRILREKGTEAAFSGEFNHHSVAGTYNCAGCDAPLYKSTSKFNSGCGWFDLLVAADSRPAFFEGIEGAINRHEDKSFFSTRTEIVCAKCDGHLGHVFKGEGFGGEQDERHCVNSVSMTFK